VSVRAVAFGVAAAAVFGADSGGDAHLLGDLLALGSLFAMTGYLLLMKHARMKGVPAAAYVAGVFLVCAVVVTPIELASDESLGTIDGEEWLWIVLLAVFAGCLGHTLMTWAQKHVN